MNDLHTKPDPALWTGRASGGQEYLHEKVQFTKFGEEISRQGDGRSFLLLGYACDEGVRRNGGRTGAAKGPDAIRKELGKMANHLPSGDQLIDMGNVQCEQGDLEKSQSVLSDLVADGVKHGGIPLLMGGGHDISFTHYRGIRSALPPSQSLGIINFDAHFDLRTFEKGPHSGSPFYQIALDCMEDNREFQYLCLGIRREANPRELFQRARELGVDYLELPDFSTFKIEGVLNKIRGFLSAVDQVYVTVDMDGFSSAFSPGTSAAFPVGFTPEIAEFSLKEIISSGKVRGLDVAETNPTYDRDDQTAKLAARILYLVMQEISLL